MAGLTFYKTRDIKKIREFYTKTIGMDIWLEQPDCLILQHDNLLIGFCESQESEISGIITFFYRSKTDVDKIHKKLKSASPTAPVSNDIYSIYQFFARDPEERVLEFQTFLNPLPPYMMGDELLNSRRSVRNFQKKNITAAVLRSVLDNCRTSPTSRNSQSYYFVVIKDQQKMKFLSSLRDANSIPISNAPLAIAVCSDPNKSKRHIQDAVIAAYHFILSAWIYGLGTCWIADMDRVEVKDLLKIPEDHYVATVTPLGYPLEIPDAPPRRETMQMVRFADEKE